LIRFLLRGDLSILRVQSGANVWPPCCVRATVGICFLSASNHPVEGMPPTGGEKVALMFCEVFEYPFAFSRNSAAPSFTLLCSALAAVSPRPFQSLLRLVRLNRPVLIFLNSFPSLQPPCSPSKEVFGDVILLDLLQS